MLLSRNVARGALTRMTALSVVLLLALLVGSAAAQNDPTNAGNGQASASVSSGINGLSTGSSMSFSDGQTQTLPSSSVVRSTTENSQASASLSSNSVQEQGSDGGYTSTTGSDISGISNSLGAGFTAPSGAGTAVQGSVSGSGNGAFVSSVPLGSTRFLDAFFVNGLVLASMLLAGAIFVL